MSTNGFLDQLKGKSHREILIASTVRYLSSLPEALADAAYRAAILRWFNAETLGGILATGDASDDRQPSSATPAQTPAEQLYEQLQLLPFIEEYPGRGHAFHESTRGMVLEHLWNERNDFYREVSNRAMQFFQAAIDAESERMEHEELELDQVDTGLEVELAYHYAIVDPEDAMAEIYDFLAELGAAGQISIYHDLLEAVGEHATAGRLSPDWAPFIEYWRLKEAHANRDWEGLDEIGQRLLHFPDTDESRYLKAQGTWYLADGLRVASRFEEAQHYYEDSLRRSQEIDDEDGALYARMGLGYLAYDMEENNLAGQCFAQALVFCVQRARLPAPEGFEYDDDTPLKVFDPSAWHRQELPDVDEDQDLEEGAFAAGEPDVALEDDTEETPEPLVQYYIEMDFEPERTGEAGPQGQEIFVPVWPIKLDPVLAELWYRLGTVQRALDRYDSADACGRLATLMFADLGDLPSVQATLQMLEGLAQLRADKESRQQIREFRQNIMEIAVSRGDQGTVLSLMLDQARSYFEDERYSLARETYERARDLAEALDLDEQKAVALEGLARLSWTDGNYAAAEAQFHSTLDLYREVRSQLGQAGIQVLLGDLYLQQRRYAEANDNLESTLHTYRLLGSVLGQTDVLTRLADVAQTQGKYRDAFGFLAQMLELARQDEGFSQEAAALTAIGRLYLTLGNEPKAQQAYDRALDIARQIGQQSLAVGILVEQAVVLSSLAEYARSIEAADQAIQIDPEAQEAYREKGWALEHLGERYALECRLAFERAAELVPDDWWAHKGVANALRLAGDDQAADEKIRWTIDQIEKDPVPSTLPSLAWCYYGLGEYDKAAELCRAVIEADPEPLSDLFDLGLVLMCAGRYAEALVEYRRGVGEAGVRFPPRTRLGHLYVAKFDLREAAKVVPELPRTPEWAEMFRLLDEAWASAAGEPVFEYELALDTVERCNYRAEFYSRQGNEQAAVAEYSRAIALEPDQVGLYVNRAQSFMILEQPEDALADLSRAIELEPENAVLWHLRAQVHTQAENYAEALTDASQAIELRPEEPEFLVFRAIVNRQVDRSEAVLADLSRVIELTPDAPDAYLNRAGYYIDLGDYSAALQDYTRVIELRPDAEHYNTRGNLYTRMSDWPAALADYGRAIELEPDPVYYSNRAWIYQVMEQPDNALADLTKAIELEPTNADGYYARAEIRIEEGDYLEALADINQAIELQPEAPGFYGARAVLYRLLDRREDVIADLSRVVDLTPDMPDGYLNRAGYYAGIGEYQAALQDYSLAIGLAPENHVARAQRASTYRAMREYELAFADLDRAVELQPEDAASLAARAELYADVGDYARALTDYTRAIELEGDDAQLYSARARVYALLAEYQRAIEDLNRSVELEPNTGVLYHFRALAYIDVGDYERALADLDFADRLEEGNESSLCYNRMWRGLALQLMDRPRRARRVWRQTRAIADGLPDPVDRHRLLALASMFLGEIETARDHYQSLFGRDPNPYYLYMQRTYLHRAKRCFPDRADIAELVEWFERR